MYFIKRHENGIVIRETSGLIVLPTSLKKYLNELCLNNLTTYEGRITATKILLSDKKNIPIYINRNLLFYSTGSLRDYNTVFVNYFSVISVVKVSKSTTRFIFTNLEEEIMEVSYQRIMKQHSKIKIIIEYLNNQIFQ